MPEAELAAHRTRRKRGKRRPMPRSSLTRPTAALCTCGRRHSRAKQTKADLGVRVHSHLGEAAGRCTTHLAGVWLADTLVQQTRVSGRHSPPTGDSVRSAPRMRIHTGNHTPHTTAEAPTGDASHATVAESLRLAPRMRIHTWEPRTTQQSPPTGDSVRSAPRISQTSRASNHTSGCSSARRTLRGHVQFHTPAVVAPWGAVGGGTLGPHSRLASAELRRLSRQGLAVKQLSYCFGRRRVAVRQPSRGTPPHTLTCAVVGPLCRDHCGLQAGAGGHPGTGN